MWLWIVVVVVAVLHSLVIDDDEYRRIQDAKDEVFNKYAGMY